MVKFFIYLIKLKRRDEKRNMIILNIWKLNELMSKYFHFVNEGIKRDYYLIKLINMNILRTVIFEEYDIWKKITISIRRWANKDNLESNHVTYLS